ncbi:hypothetical protein [Halorussus halophilus]|uniref:hypothetical protein n=1 Tax=Halorussus halophilus TaxID=2650975 RepID=UPI0013012BA2|nr:hypothetical protein [Halorussus halophilus]
MHHQTRLFHLHFNTPAVASARRALADHGVPLRQKFGHVSGESVVLAPDDEAPEDFRLRLQSHRRGYVDVTLAPGTRPHFDHLGVCTSEFDRVVARAEDVGWSVRDTDGRRPFVMTPWGFRVEVHRDGSDLESSLGDWDSGHLTEVELRVSDPDEVLAGLERVFGDLPELVVAQANDEADRPFVSRFTIAGDALSERVVNVQKMLRDD